MLAVVDVAIGVKGVAVAIEDPAVAIEAFTQLCQLRRRDDAIALVVLFEDVFRFFSTDLNNGSNRCQASVAVLFALFKRLGDEVQLTADRFHGVDGVAKVA